MAAGIVATGTAILNKKYGRSDLNFSAAASRLMFLFSIWIEALLKPIIFTIAAFPNFAT
ncbi:MAG: hypothetical protein MnENMB40S_22270 [Rhizobiaceae bacterium MnEN-MB40S]|nr:MAG: hypothetical protein MnENMB40S_22270 [Rhizobiaceae bacterium MnEN-MB40S]